MRQFFLILGLAFATFLLTNALDSRVFTDTPAVSSFVPQSAETPGAALLDEVISMLSPQRVQWLQMTVLQKMFEGNSLSEGRYVLGPGHRRRLEMKVHGDDIVGNVLVVSDGQSLCRARWSQGKKPRVNKTVLPGGDPRVSASDRAAIRDRYLQECGLGGLLPLLTQIREHLLQPVMQVGLCQGRKAVRLSGSWKADETKLNSLPDHLRLRQCAIYLDADSLWPYRIEWIGSPQPVDRLVLLMQMDFRDPVINQPLSAAEAAKVFHFPFDCSNEALAAEEKLRHDEEVSFNGI